MLAASRGGINCITCI